MRLQCYTSGFSEIIKEGVFLGTRLGLPWSVHRFYVYGKWSKACKKNTMEMNQCKSPGSFSITFFRLDQLNGSECRIIILKCNFISTLYQIRKKSFPSTCTLSESAEQFQTVRKLGQYGDGLSRHEMPKSSWLCCRLLFWKPNGPGHGQQQ